MVVSKQAHAAGSPGCVERRFWRIALVAGMALVAFEAMSAGSVTAQTKPGDAGATPARKVKSAKAKPAAKNGGEGSESGETAAAAAAEKSYEAGLKAAQAGKHELAVQQFDAALQGGKLPTSVMARALYQRGIAQRKLNRPVQAIADLTSASWLKGGLNDSERADALAQRADAYKEAGIAESDGPTSRRGSPAATGAAPAAPASAAWSTETSTARKRRAAASAPAAATALSLAPTQPATGDDGARAAATPRPAAAAEGSAPAGTSDIGSFFGGLFGGFAQPSAGEPAKSAITTSATNPAAPSETAVSGWSQGTAVKGTGAAARATARTAAAAPAASAPGPAAATASGGAAKASGGKYRLQAAAVRSVREAKAIADKIKKDHASAIAGREPAIEETVVGNMGTFYRVSVGPFADAKESQAVCGKLRAGGFDCLMLTH